MNVFVFINSDFYFFCHRNNILIKIEAITLLRLLQWRMGIIFDITVSITNVGMINRIRTGTTSRNNQWYRNCVKSELWGSHGNVDGDPVLT